MKKNDAAVSELIGAILLVSLVTLAASIIAVMVLSQPPPEDIPQITAIAENQSQTVYLLHTGGDSLQEHEIKAMVNGMDSSFSLDNNENWPWSAGKILKVDYPGPGMPEYIQLVYKGGSAQSLILTAYFVPSITTGAPTGLPTTSPTTIPTTIPTTVPTTMPTTTPTTEPTPTCGTITGSLFHDLNHNHVWDSGEPGLLGWTVNVFKKQGNNWIWTASAITNSNGGYFISSLPFETGSQYLLEAYRPPGWIQSYPTWDEGQGGFQTSNDYVFVLNPSPSGCFATGKDFGFYYY